MKVKFSNLKITSISSCVPKTSFDLLTLSNGENINELNKIIKTTGIESVRVASDDITTSDLCYTAAESLFNENHIDRNLIDGLVFVSQTGDYKLPQTSHILQHRLKLNTNTLCLDLPIGCTGYIYGIYQASLMIRSKSCKKVLLLAGDTTSKIINNEDKSLKMVFGDGASATLIEEGKDDISCIIHSDGENSHQLIIPNGGCRNPTIQSNADLIFDKDGNKRTLNDLYMDGMGIFNFAISKIPSLINEILEYNKYNNDEIDAYILHQANKFMIDYLRKKTKISLAKMPIMVNGFGNTGPNSIPLVLTQLYHNNNKSLNKVVLCGFGVGLSWGALTCNLSETIILNTIEH